MDTAIRVSFQVRGEERTWAVLVAKGAEPTDAQWVEAIASVKELFFDHRASVPRQVED